MRFFTPWCRSARLGTALVLSLSSGCMSPGPAQQHPAAEQATRSALKIGVVDVGLLFKSYERKAAFETQNDDLRQRLKAEMEHDVEEMRRKALSGWGELPFRDGEAPWLRDREKRKLAHFELELKQERLQSRLKYEVEQSTLRILTELETTIAEWGAQNGYDLIIRIDKADRSSLRGEDQLAEHAQERFFRAQVSDAPFFNESLDVTQTVLGYLNSDENLKRMERLEK